VPAEGIVAVIAVAIGLVLLRIVLASLWDRYPITGLILLGLPITAFGAYAIFYGVRERRQAPDQPVAMSLAEAIEQSRERTQWVSIDGTGDMQWDCDSIVYSSHEEKGVKRQWMDVILADRAKSTVVNVKFQVQFSCADLQAETPDLTGEISRFGGRDHRDLNTNGRLDKYQGAETYVQLCTFCAPAGRFYAALIGGGTLVILGLIFSIIFARHQFVR
jgi:hypothetical protein